MLERIQERMRRLTLAEPLKKSVLAVTLVLSLMSVAGLVTAGGWRLSKPTSAEKPRPVTPPTRAKQWRAAEAPEKKEAKERIGSELITITRFGFEPAEITRRAGKFMLLVENRSPETPLTLRIESDQRNRIIDVVQRNDELDWARELNLHPGRYTITVAERSDWICRITITD